MVGTADGKKRIPLAIWIFFGLLAGVVVGLCQHLLLPADWNRFSVRYMYEPIGTLFLNGIRLAVVPLVLVSLALGTAGIGDVRKLGRIGGKTMVIYLVTTMVAITVGLFLASVIRPGTGLTIPTDASFKPAASRTVMDAIVGIVPVNPFAAMAEGNMLQIIFVALLAGVAINLVGSLAEPVLRGLSAADRVIQKMVHLVMLFAPVGVLALMAKMVIGHGTLVFAPMLKYMMVVFGALLFQGLVVYPGALTILGGLNPLRFYSNIYPAMLVAFSTSSSNATLPVSMEVARERLGVREDIYSFALPLGATINMDGTAIMQAVATVFIANICGLDMGAYDFLKVVLMATLASIGTAGVPGAGIVMLTMILNQLGLPVEGIAIVLGVDRVLDMSRTVINITGDLMTTAIVGRSEGAMDMAVFLQQNTQR